MSELPQEDLVQFNDHLTALADDAGIELDDAERMRLFQLSQEGGFNPSATINAFAELYPDDDDVLDDDDFEDDEEEGPPDELVADVDLQLEQLSRDMGRSLTDREIADVSKTANLQMRSGARVDLRGALDDYESQFATSQSRSEFFARRMSESANKPELRDEYDLDKPDDRAAYYDARLNGVGADEFEDAGGEAA